MLRVVRRVQRGLEALYRVDTGVDISEFVIDDATRAALSPARAPREQLLVAEAAEAGGGDAQVALYLDPAALANLAARDPARRLDRQNLGDFLLVVEGVSHFIYTLLCARDDRRLSALELELQAEVDKYVTCLLVTSPSPAVSAVLRRRLFGDAVYEDDLDDDETGRYRAANDNAQRYAASLEDRYVAPRRIPAMLGELRRFYRAGLAEKLGVIARAA